MNGEYTFVPNHALSSVPPEQARRQSRLPSNQIKTTRYTPLSFVPCNLLEQFHRFANVYFVFIAILNFVPQVEAINPWAAIFPPLFIFAVTAAKDGREYAKRAKLDERINKQLVRVWEPKKGFGVRQWQEVKVGDVVEVELNDVIPADILLLESSDKNGVCFIETANLDGETNLKQKAKVPVEFDSIDHFNYQIRTDPPNADLNRFEAVCVPSGDSNGEKVPLGGEHILYRGCVLRNTDRISGLVVYAGGQTKAMLSNSGARHKSSLLEGLMNRDIILFAGLLIVLCSSAAAASVALQERHNLWYITPQLQKPGKLFIHGFFVFLTMVILLQILIPISLYVSLELVKLLQIAFIQWDLAMWSESFQSGVQCRTFNITEDLGSVEHVFCDKTGTLTENEMVFRRFAVDGVDYPHLGQKRALEEQSRFEHMSPLPLANGHSSLTLSSFVDNDSLRSSIRPKSHHRRKCESSDDDQETAKIIPDQAAITLISPNFDDKISMNDFMLCLVTCNTVVIGQKLNKPSRESLSPSKIGFLKQVKSKFKKTPTIGCEVHTNETIVFETDKETSGFVYEAESPDEAALVNTAAAYGVILSRRDHQAAACSWPGRDEELTADYLAVLPFDSDRKMMSVVVEVEGRVLLLAKGADSAILNRLVKTDKTDQVQQTMKHLEDYCLAGLRTLCIAKRALSKEESDQLLRNLHDSRLGDKNELKAAFAALESDLELIGVTAIEDRLQEGVPETIESLRDAGLSIWVLTGDKMETAVEIGRLCKLISPEDNVVRVSGTANQTYTLLVHLAENIKPSTVLAINGENLNYALTRHRQLFITVAGQCRAVLCCRTTPRDKGQVVQLMGRELNVRTLAIGDGANDVSMIRCANVGCGIAGAEGRQAVMAADFALPRFYQLRRLLLVHGHLSYARMARMIEYFYYKSTVFIFLLFWFQFHNQFSGRNVVN